MQMCTLSPTVVGSRKKLALFLWSHWCEWEDLAELLKFEVNSGWRCLWKEQLQPRILFWELLSGPVDFP